MGLLRDLIDQKYAKKRQEEATQLEGLKYVLQNSQDPKIRQTAVEQLMKGHPSAKPILELLKPQLLSGGRKAEKGAAKEDASERPSTGGMQMFSSKEDLENSALAFEKKKREQENVLDIQKQVALGKAKAAADREATTASFQDEAKDIQQIWKSDQPEELKQTLIAARSGVRPEAGSYKGDVLEMANGLPMPVLVKDGQVFTMNRQKLDVPPGAMLSSQKALLKKEEPKAPTAEQTKDERAFSAYREKNKLQPEAKLTAIQQQHAIADQKDAEEPSDTKAMHNIAAMLAGQKFEDEREKNLMVPSIADGIMSGRVPPDMNVLRYQGVSGKVMAELTRRGFDLSTAEKDWNATTQHLRTLNGAQQERIWQSVSTLERLIPDTRTLYEDWKKTGLPSGMKIYNRAALKAAANLPGEKGVAAQKLLTNINDMTDIIGAIYMGGNSPTDKALDLAGSNLKGDWNPEQFKGAIDLLEHNVGVRKNSIMTSEPRGASAGSPYGSAAAATPASGQGGGSPQAGGIVIHSVTPVH